MSISWSRAAGIGILTVVLGIALLIGCWYCRRRSGYRTLTNMSTAAKLTLPSSSSQVPNAPPAYEKLSSDQSPPPYSP
ncbi:hypothetical protein A6R68_13460 [Neotoma lepida]|uniref:Melanoma antigen recognized by T-cells 1 n=1 Tax=Neotoma lepida TaxID=56216 RepID=A0A1A6H051_NEOLE|nr:hypothetical protein A6R68_13460 [Neotoma lepida]